MSTSAVSHQLSEDLLEEVSQSPISYTPLLISLPNLNPSIFPDKVKTLHPSLATHPLPPPAPQLVIGNWLIETLMTENATSSPNPWNYKPWWCQPWSIILTGLFLIGGSGWLSRNIAIVVVVGSGVALWWGYFLVLWPELIRQSGILESDPHSLKQDDAGETTQDEGLL